MRMPFSHHERQNTSEIKMTPMIDVIFLLLIFFVCTASFRAVEEILPARLLSPGGAESQAPVDPETLDLDEVVVRIEWASGRPCWRINERDYDRFDEVRAVLGSIARVKKDLPVILDINAAVPLENVIDAYDACRLVGLTKIEFAASENP